MLWNHKPMYLFRPDAYKDNCLKINRDWFYTEFSYYWGYWGWDFAVIPFDYEKYANSFAESIPEDSVLYFDKSSKIQRAKLPLSKLKRTSKVSNAEYIVVNKKANIRETDRPFVLFENKTEVIGFECDAFEKHFKSDFQNAVTWCHDIRDWDSYNFVYSGNLYLVNETQLLDFASGKYSKKFVLDSEVNKIINNNLPTLTLEDAVGISELLTSDDKSLRVIGTKALNTYNIQNNPLTVRLLLSVDTRWYYNKNIAQKNICDILDYHASWETKNGMRYMYKRIQRENEKYSEQDINLSKELAKNIPQILEWITEDSFVNRYPEITLIYNWIPDEYRYKSDSN